MSELSPPARRPVVGIALAVLGVAVLAAVAVGVLAKLRLVNLRGMPSRARIAYALDAVRAQAPPPGSARVVTLPGIHSTLTHDGRVTLLRTHDGRLYAFGKTFIGWKDNYTGFVYGEAPLHPAELRADGYGRRAIHLLHETVDLGAVRRDHGGGLYEVFFDLN